MLIEVWDRASLKDQEDTIGRNKVLGAPLGGANQADEFADFKPKALPDRSHVRLAHPDTNAGVKILRRGYSFTDGLESLGELDAGLFFLAYMHDPTVVHHAPEPPRRQRQAQRVHQARRLRPLGDPARRPPRRLRG